MDDRLKELMQELGNAINESLSDSDRIAAAIGEIKRAGYDVFLVLEATIGFNKREDREEETVAGVDEVIREEIVPPAQPKGLAKRISWSSQDLKFLKHLKISVEDGPR